MAADLTWAEDVLCPEGLTACGESCVDLNIDAAHCGACDLACAEDEICYEALCKSCEVDCTEGQQSCSEGLDAVLVCLLQEGCPAWGEPVVCPAYQSCNVATSACELFGGGDPGWFVDFQPLHTQNATGGVLTDIVRHCPAEWVSWYWDSDRVTRGHETTHGVNAYIRNEMTDLSVRQNGFYVLENRAVILTEPDLRKSQAAPYVPASLRGSRYSLYITGMSDWDDTPTYIFDEWVSYANGTTVAVTLHEAGDWTYGWRDACMGTLEFVVYSVALAMATEEQDSAYFQSNSQFSEFVAWQLRRSMDLVRRCKDVDTFAFASQDTYYANLRTSEDAQELRDFLQRTYGADFTAEVLDLE